MKLKKIAQIVSLICVAGPVVAQQAAPSDSAPPQKRFEDAQKEHTEFCLRRHSVTRELAAEWTAKTTSMQDAQAEADRCRAAEIEVELLLQEAA